MLTTSMVSFFFFFNDTAPPEISSLPLHDALPILTEALQQRPRDLVCGTVPIVEGDDDRPARQVRRAAPVGEPLAERHGAIPPARRAGPLGVSHRSEEHTSELQSQSNLVCRLLLEK